MKDYGLFINGQWEAAKGGKTADSINPATEEAWAKVAVADREDVRKAVAAAKKAHDSGVWRSKSKEERAKVLQRRVHADGDDVGSRRHHLADDGLGEIDDGLQELATLFL